MASLSLIVLRTSKPETMLLFYNALGFEFVQEQHGSGPLHYSSETDGIILEVYPAEAASILDYQIGGSTMLGFMVESLADTLADLQILGITPLAAPKKSSWGWRALVLDPDGRAIELTEPA